MERSEMNDGSFYASGRSVYRRPFQSAGSIRMGFRVCTLTEGVSDDGAQQIADALNAQDKVNGTRGAS